MLTTPDPAKARELLRLFLEEMGLTKHSVAPLLETTHVSVGNWLDGEIPSEDYREAIETLTSAWERGPIPEPLWGQTRKEAERKGKLANVRAYRKPATEKAA
jgi:hypothetical protein